MSVMALVDAPLRFPTACVCGNQSGQQVDTMIELASGHVYLCRRCVGSAARLMGFLSREEYESLLAEIAALDGQVAELQQSVSYERDHKLVDAKEFADYLLREAAAAGVAS